MAEKKFKNTKNKKFAGIAWIMAILVLAIAVFINMMASKLDLIWDISPNKQYSLSETTKNYLEKASQDGEKIDFYLLQDLDEIEKYATADDSQNTLALYRALQEYNSYDCVNLVSFDPNSNEEIMQKINPDNSLTLSEGDMVIINGDIKKRIPSNTMYTADSVDNEGNVVSFKFTGENIITGTIKSVIDGFTPTVYFLTGHGEKSLTKDYTQFKKNLENYNYMAKSLNLSEVNAVPDDAALIIVPAPTTDITTDEKDKLDSYLDNGGNLSLLMSPNGGKFNYTNLDAIMKDFSIVMDYDKVYETDSANHVSGDNTTIQCELVKIEDDSEAADLTSALMNEGLVTFMPESRSFYFTYDSNFSNLKASDLIKTYSSAVGEAYGGTDDIESIKDTQLSLAAFAENNSRNQSKLVVFGNAEFIDDTNVSSDYVIVPVYLYLSTISWMYDTDVDMGIGSKTTSYDYITIGSEGNAKFIMTLFVILPVAILIIGIGIWMKRRNS